MLNHVLPVLRLARKKSNTSNLFMRKKWSLYSPLYNIRNLEFVVIFNRHNLSREQTKNAYVNTNIEYVFVNCHGYVLLSGKHVDNL